MNEIKTDRREARRWLIDQLVDRLSIFLMLATLGFVQIGLMSDYLQRTGEPAAGLNIVYGLYGLVLLAYLAKPIMLVSWWHYDHWLTKSILAAFGLVMLWGIADMAIAAIRSGVIG